MRKILLLLSFFVALSGEAFAVIGFESSTESHTGTTGSQSQASFDITVPFTANSKGLLVFTYNANSNANDGTSVKIDPAGTNRDVPAVTGGLASDTVGEPGSCKAWFLGTGAFPSSNTTVRINRNNNANIMYAVAITVTAGANTYYNAGGSTPVLQEGDGAIAESFLNTNAITAMRFQCGYNGSNNAPAAGANSTLLQSIDFGSFTAGACRETTAGSGDRSAGCTASSDDRAAVTLAIAEIPACSGTTWTSTGIKATGASSSNADSATLTLGDTSTNSFIAVSVSIFDSDANPASITVSDNINGTYTSSFYQGITNGGIGIRYFPTNPGGNLIITANPDGATSDFSIMAHEFCGGHATPASGSPVTATGSSTTPSTGAMTPADNNVLLLASVVAHVTPGTITENAGGQGFTLSNEREDGFGGTSSFVYKIISGAPGTPSESWTTTNSGAWAAGIAAFKPAFQPTPVVRPHRIINY